jgi:glyoxylase-like metal-dependent hydrolase (beta-lactamase superfamily II)
MSRRVHLAAVVACGALAGAALTMAPVAAQQPGSHVTDVFDLLIQSRSMETPRAANETIPLPEGNPLTLLPVDGNVYLLAGGPSNVTLHIGTEGVLVVDSATSDISDYVLEAIGLFTDAPISYVINTTSDPLHYGGNAALGNAGQNPTVAPRGLAGPGSDPDNGGGGGNNPQQLRPQGAIVFSHENVLNRMSLPSAGAAGEPFEMWPSNTFFTQRKTLWFNDEPIEFLHQPSAHTDGDLMVFFRRSDVVVAGDIIHTLQYPVIDAERGGSINGVLAGMNAIIDITVPRFNQQGGTKVIPGHGRILNEADVVEYRDMITIIRDRIALAIEQGMTLEQIQALGPTLDYDGLYSVPEWTGEMFIEAIYRDLVD